MDSGPGGWGMSGNGIKPELIGSHMHDIFLPYLPIDAIVAAYRCAPGKELEKLENPESSAALVANTFGLFLDRPQDLPPIPGLEAFDWPAKQVRLEVCARFPWRGGLHPWLDVMIETDDYLIG